jgi:hypothetical protein
VDVSSRMMTIYHIWHVALVQGGLGAGVDDMVGGVGANSALGVGVRKGGARIDAFERGGWMVVWGIRSSLSRIVMGRK